MRLSMSHRPTHPMTDPKNPEAQNEELDLEQLEDAAGGHSVSGVNMPLGWGSKTGMTEQRNKKGIGKETPTQRPTTGWSSSDAEFNG